MKDYIEREQAITVFKTFYGKSLRVVLDALREEHAADVQPVVRGKWMHKEITVDLHVVGQCSVCKERRRIDNYCPNCGADMREKT